jgi:hypothetical protein
VIRDLPLCNPSEEEQILKRSNGDRSDLTFEEHLDVFRLLGVDLLTELAERLGDADGVPDDGCRRRQSGRFGTLGKSGGRGEKGGPNNGRNEEGGTGGRGQRTDSVEHAELVQGDIERRKLLRFIRDERGVDGTLGSDG